MHRSVFDHWIVDFKDPGKALAWIDLISMANHAPGTMMIKSKVIEIARGQTGCSQLTLQKRWKWSQNKVKRFLVMLEKHEMITFKADDLTTLITICNYESYQGEIETGGRPHGRPVERPLERIADDQSNDKQECNKNKNEKKNKNARKKSKTLTTAGTEAAAKRKEVWLSYSNAFFNRYSVEPQRNAKASSLNKQLHERLGDDAKFVAAFYLTDNDQFVVKNRHDLGFLVSKAEKYSTDWKLGKSLTTTSARQMDQSQSNFDAAKEANRRMRAKNAQR